MKCPKCKASLSLIERSDVNVDYCELCYGIWLDNKELDRIVSFRQENPQNSIKILTELLTNNTEVIEEKSHACPRCNEIMQKIKFAARENVIADECPKCRGLWFDKGELILVTDSVEEKKNEKPVEKIPTFSVLPSLLAITIILMLFTLIGFLVITFAN